MKEKISFLFLAFLFFHASLSADQFAQLIQDLAVQTACLGQYNAAQAGGGEDPHDYYTPRFLRDRFVRMSGNRTRTDTFYGVCFDYAQSAWNDIKQYRQSYLDAGMADNEWYIAANAPGNSCIVLYDPAGNSRADITMNGVPLKEKMRMYVTPHPDYAGVPAVNHAWLWVRHRSGTWYWIDPTWTDNTGYVHYGVVSGSREVYLVPERAFCMVPFPSSKITAAVPKNRVPSSGYKPSGSSFRDKNTHALLFGIQFSASSSDFGERFGFSGGYESTSWHPFVRMFTLDVFQDAAEGDDGSLYVLFGLGLGIQLLPRAVLYGGAGVGYDGGEDGWDITGAAWKVNGGIRIKVLERYYARIDISGGSLGAVVSCYAGFGW